MPEPLLPHTVKTSFQHKTRRSMSIHQTMSLPPCEPPLMGERPAASIAPALHDALSKLVVHEEMRDLALARALRARDFNTQEFGGTVRNVLPLAGFGPGGPSLEQLATLILGRDFIAIVHGHESQVRLTLILNDHNNPHNPAELAIWRDDHQERLQEGSLHNLITSCDDRLLLGPLTRERAREITQEAPCYHEYSSRENCAINALNAMIGRALLNKALMDKLLIGEIMHSEQGKALGITESDFYVNTAREEIRHLCDFENGLRPEWLIRVLRKAGPKRNSDDEDEFTLPGSVSFFGVQCRTSQYDGSYHQQLLQFAEAAERKAQGLVICDRGRFIAFVKARSASSPEPGWYMVDSTRSDQPRKTPLDYLKAAGSNRNEAEPIELIAWQPDT